MTLQEQFNEAVEISKQIKNRPDNDTLLKLYSLYKQATDGDAPSDGPSNPFDIIGKIKHGGWAKLKGMSAEDAMKEYLAIFATIKKD